jgi:hypothetical protein
MPKTGLFLHAGKCELFTRETTFCGRHLSADVIVFDPRRSDTLCSMSLSAAGADLQQFICALGWMCRAIPNFARRTHVLQAVLEEGYSRAGGRTRRHASRVPLVSTACGPLIIPLFANYIHIKPLNCSTSMLIAKCAFTVMHPIVAGLLYLLTFPLQT